MAIGWDIAKMKLFLPDGTLYIPETIGVQYWQVKHDYEIGGGLRQNLPEVFRLNPQHYVLMTEDIQYWMFNILSVEMDKVGATIAQKKAAWGYLYDGGRAFTNLKGVNTHKDFIRRINLDKQLPGLSTLICGGNILTGTEVVAKWGTSPEPCLQVNTISPIAPLKSVSRETTPALVQYATISTLNKLDNGTYKVTRFSAPAMMGANAAVPIMSRDPVVFPLRLLKRLAIGSPVPTPYNY
jgi:hypothetical protein